MEKLFDITLFDSYKEDNRREVKKAKDGLPLSLWDTYSAFANSYGGVIVLGVKEESDGSWRSTGLKDENKLQKEFWNTINNTTKVSLNLLKDEDVEIHHHMDDVIMVVHVPAARRDQKPVYINNDMFGGTFRRNYEGDYHCSRLQVKTMLRDQADETIDMSVLDSLTMDVFNIESLRGYRNMFASLKGSHPFSRLDDAGFLRSIGAAAISDKDHGLHPTAAGLLMFGNEYDVLREFPDYFLDYRANLDSGTRWTDRVNSSTGDWSGNVFDFFFRVYNKLKQNLKVPFGLDGETRIDDTPLHEALREALANCLVNADYFGARGVVVTLLPERIEFANPGYSRTGREQMLIGGISDPRNRGLMKMFNLIGIGERAGSGVPRIFDIWSDAELQHPIVEEQFDPDRTILTLPLLADEGNGHKQKDSKAHTKLSHEKRKEMILEYLKDHGRSTCAEIAALLNLSLARTRAILSEIPDVEAVGDKRYRTYRVK